MKLMAEMGNFRLMLSSNGSHFDFEEADELLVET